MKFPIFQSSCGNKHDRISVFPMLTITCSGCFLYLLFYLFPNFCDIYCPDNMSLTIAIFASNGHSALFFSYNECKKIRRGNKVLTLLNLGITFFDLFLSHDWILWVSSSSYESSCWHTRKKLRLVWKQYWPSLVVDVIYIYCFIILPPSVWDLLHCYPVTSQSLSECPTCGDNCWPSPLCIFSRSATAWVAPSLPSSPLN